MNRFVILTGMMEKAFHTILPMAVTMGDPAGIGPEIVARMFLRRLAQRCWIVVGDPLVMHQALTALDSSASVRRIATPAEARFEDGVLNVLASSECVELPPMGQISAESGRAAYAAVVTATHLAKAGTIRGIITAPINKEALAAAGLHYPGHTEILAEQAGGSRVAMMLANEDIRVVLVTTHCSLREAIQEERLAEAPSPPPLLHPNMAELYRQKIASLHASLQNEATGTQAREAIRSLITRIKLIPENGELGIFLEGDLAAMLGFAVHNKKNAMHHPDAGVLEKFLVQDTLVAGVGFEPTAFRL